MQPLKHTLPDFVRSSKGLAERCETMFHCIRPANVPPRLNQTPHKARGGGSRYPKTRYRAVSRATNGADHTAECG